MAQIRRDCLERSDDSRTFDKFMGLAPELRNRIYEFVLGDLDDFTEAVHIPQQPAITRTSRQVRRESLGLWYSTTTFVLHTSLVHREPDTVVIDAEASAPFDPEFYQPLLSPACRNWLAATGPRNIASFRRILVTSDRISDGLLEPVIVGDGHVNSPRGEYVASVLELQTKPLAVELKKFYYYQSDVLQFSGLAPSGGYVGVLSKGEVLTKIAKANRELQNTKLDAESIEAIAEAASGQDCIWRNEELGYSEPRFTMTDEGLVEFVEDMSGEGPEDWSGEASETDSEQPSEEVSNER